MARDFGVPISAHVGGSSTALAFLRDNDLLGPNVLLSHANGYDDEDLKHLAESGTAVAVSPTIEPVMGHGLPITGRALGAGITTSLGADVVTSGPGDMFSLMRAAYLLDRGRTTTREVLTMATTQGAAALGLSAITGAIRPGYAADIVLLRTDLPSTSPTHDPTATVVLNADTRAVDTVLVAGRIVKQDGHLLTHDLPALLTSAQEAAHRIGRFADPLGESLDHRVRAKRLVDSARAETAVQCR